MTEDSSPRTTQSGSARWRTRLLTLLAVPALAYGVLAIFGAMMEYRLIFPRGGKDASRTASTENLETLTSAFGDEVAFIHLRNAEDPTPWTLLFLPGSGRGLTESGWFIRALHNRGWDVAALDYPGTGASTGRPSEAATHAAVAALYEYLIENMGLAPERLIVFGRSLGASAALHLAAEQPVGGVIAEGAFLSAFEILGPMRWLPWTRFDNRAAAAEIDVPVLFIHGTHDRTAPFEHARKLKAMTGEYGAHFWIEGAGHHDILEFAGEAYWTVQQEFAATLEPGKDADERR